ncbi:penicillin-binding protein 2 [Pacificibacter marinus]|uniref:Stage V sporulation protein D n=1 Tax=Pacificibacter marinus TaxID=658057 RepID=A0A1Y5SDM9_9RHOB|nr:penicillin-binding protein 2 [Pacificibacter marinus]SEK52128.1 peptidoglycan glycosyltransferase [Pacificibacter marinus]SLN38345.1 Stage V sporulation protein D [Pacificibacter marinus]
MRRSPADTAESAKKLTRRTLFLGGSQLVFMGALGLRMRYMQVDQAEEFRLLADENRLKIHLLPPARGLIYDRSGTVIAENEQTFRIVIRKEDASQLDMVLAELETLIGLTQDDQDRVRKELKNAGPSAPVTILDRLTWEAFSTVAANAPALPGVSPEVGLSRDYPLKDDFAHLIGYVGPVSSYDLSRMDHIDPLMRIPKFPIGKSGVEKMMEDTLRGNAGTVRVEQNVHGRIIRELERKEGIAGNNLQLTLDHQLQNFVQARLAGESASAVIMDVETGDILAAGSTPAFDPNLFVRGISIINYNALLENIYRPLPSKSVQGAYPPGSTFKMVTALAALEAGVVTPDETVRCMGHTEVGGRRFHCWKRAGHGNINLTGSLRHSCDVYYYEMAQRAGIENIAAMGRRLGLGEEYDLPLPGMSSGLMPDKQWKRDNRGADWVIGDSLNASIGQGFVLTTPMQLAVMTSRLATGREIVPRLIKSIDGVEQPIKSGGPLNINENMLRSVRQGMYEVSNSNRGTAYSSRIVTDGMRLAGKTGTSQTRNAVVNNKNVPWEERDHALFVAFAPHDAPKYAVSVVIEHGGGGSTAAAPVARDLMLFALHGAVPPLASYPQSQRGTIKTLLDALPLRTDGDNATKRSNA